MTHSYFIALCLFLLDEHMVEECPIFLLYTGKAFARYDDMM